MRVLADKLHSSHKSSSFGAHGLFLFPNTDAGWLATVRIIEMPRHAIGRPVGAMDKLYGIETAPNSPCSKSQRGIGACTSSTSKLAEHWLEADFLVIFSGLTQFCSPVKVLKRT